MFEKENHHPPKGLAIERSQKNLEMCCLWVTGELHCHCTFKLAFIFSI